MINTKTLYKKHYYYILFLNLVFYFAVFVGVKRKLYFPDTSGIHKAAAYNSWFFTRSLFYYFSKVSGFLGLSRVILSSPVITLNRSEVSSLFSLSSTLAQQKLNVFFFVSYNKVQQNMVLFYAKLLMTRKKFVIVFKRLLILILKVLVLRF